MRRFALGFVVTCGCTSTDRDPAAQGSTGDASSSGGAVTTQATTQPGDGSGDGTHGETSEESGGSSSSSSDDGGTTGDCGDAPCPACAEGAVEAACTCGDELVTQGFCCAAIPFDAAYASLTNGCPSGARYFVDREHAGASDDNPGTADAPWATIQHAVAVAVPGDTVVIEASTYTVIPTDSRLEPALNPANSGVAGSPIVFKGHGGPVVTTEPSVIGAVASASASSITFDASAPAEDGAYEGWYVRLTSGAATDEYRRIAAYDGNARTATFAQPLPAVPQTGDGYQLTIPGPILGVNARDHIVWDGMVVVERDSYHPDTGPVVWWDSSDGAFIGNEIVGQTTLLQDNHNALRLNGAHRVLVRNNSLHGVQPIDLGENNPQNHAAIMIYVSSELVFEHNEIYDSYAAFFPKGETGPHVFRFNAVHDVAKGVRLSYHQDVDIVQNLFYDCELGVQPADEIVGIRVYNNVFFRSDAGVYNWFPISGIDVFNNVFVDVDRPFQFDAGVGTIASDHNVFFGFDAFVVDGGDVGGLPGWQGLGYDAASVAGDPGVVDADALDFHPIDGSIMPTAGIDLADHDGDGDTTETIPVGIYIGGDEIVGRVQ